MKSFKSTVGITMAKRQLHIQAWCEYRDLCYHRDIVSQRRSSCVSSVHRKTLLCKIKNSTALPIT